MSSSHGQHGPAAGSCRQGGTAEERTRAILELTRSFSFLTRLRSDGSVRLEWASDSFTRDFGYTVDELGPGGGVLSLVHPDDLDRATAMAHAIAAGEHARGDVRVVAKDGRVRWVRFQYSIESGPDPTEGVRIFGVGQDVTEEVEANAAALRESARLRAFFDRSPIGQVIVSPEQTILAVNPAFCDLTGYKEAELIEQSASIFAHPDFLPTAHARFEWVRDSGANRIDHASRWLTKEGRTIEVALTVVPERDADGQILQFVTAVQDITAGKRAQRERQVLVERLVDAHAEERVRLARELHDGLGQVLTSAALYARSAEGDAPPSLAASLSVLRAQLDEALALTRTLVWRLRPVEVEELGLARAVHALAEKIRQRHGIPVDVAITRLNDLTDTAETALYRVVQEAVTNAVRHAEPQAVSIVIVQRGELVTAVIEDDGRGFLLDDPKRSRPVERGVGILGMQERAASIGGALVIDSRLNRGTMVRLEMPARVELP